MAKDQVKSGRATEKSGEKFSRSQMNLEQPEQSLGQSNISSPKGSQTNDSTLFEKIEKH